MAWGIWIRGPPTFEPPFAGVKAYSTTENPASSPTTWLVILCAAGDAKNSTAAPMSCGELMPIGGRGGILSGDTAGRVAVMPPGVITPPGSRVLTVMP